VFVGDVVYVRWASTPVQECAALVVAVETQPKPQIVIKLSSFFLVPVLSESMYQINEVDRIRRLQLERVHVRFVIDRLIIKVSRFLNCDYLPLAFQSRAMTNEMVVRLCLNCLVLKFCKFWNQKLVFLGTTCLDFKVQSSKWLRSRGLDPTCECVSDL